jgi:hypothetical protein
MQSGFPFAPDFVSERFWSIMDNVAAGLIVVAVLAIARKLRQLDSEWLKYAVVGNAVAAAILVASPYSTFVGRWYLDLSYGGIIVSVSMVAARLQVSWILWFALIAPNALAAYAAFVFIRIGAPRPLEAVLSVYPLAVLLTSFFVLLVVPFAIPHLQRQGQSRLMPPHLSGGADGANS